MTVMVFVFGFAVHKSWKTYNSDEWAFYTAIGTTYVYIFICIYSLYDLLKSENEPVTTQSAQEYVFTRPSDGPPSVPPKRDAIEMQQPPSYDQVVRSDAKGHRLVAQAP
jgi:hypothetical protein